jgi:toxic protein SymE
METFTEEFEDKETLFDRVAEILDENGLYRIDEVEKGYKLNYWFQKDNVYRVIKGQDNDGLEFNHMPYEIDDYIDPVYLDEGDILIFETEIKGEIWFTCTTMLEGKEEMDSECAMGFVECRSLSAMLKKGLIEKVPSGDLNPTPEKKVTFTKLTCPENCISPLNVFLTPDNQSLEDAPELPDTEAIIDKLDPEWPFEIVQNTFDLLKSAVENITSVRGYSGRGTANGIRTIKITELSYLTYSSKYYHYPHIRLSGRWIERAGFKLGDFVQVISMDGMVLVLPVRQPGNGDE